MSESPPKSAKPGTATTSAEMAHAEKLLAGDAHPEKKSGGHGGGSGEKPAGTKKKKKGKGKETLPLSARVTQSVKVLRGQIVEIFKSLRSPDGPTRRMSMFFFLSVALLIALGGWMVRRSIHQRHELEVQVAAAQQEDLERSKEAALLGKSEAPANPNTLSMLNLGHFTIELKPLEGPAKKKSANMNMAEIELVVECDSAETRTFIEENLVQARNQITDIFLSMDRAELLSREGKRKLKKHLIDRLNGWMPRGKVRDVFFSSLVIA